MLSRANYQEQDILRLARRRDTSKRAYLLVNPLQAKHVPSRPGEALAMMEALGRALAAEYPDTGLVVGFAETATAIGAVTAGFFPAGCVYLTTTRERLPEVRDWVLFREEHSHAAQQKLCGDGLRERLRHTKQLIFVEDELSTGRTMGNVVRQLRETYPEMADMPVIAASLLNRMSEENIQQLRELGVTCRWLVRIPQEDYTPRVLQYTPMEPVDCRGSAAEEPESLYLGCALPNPRLGVPVAQYQRCCGALVGAALEKVRSRLRGHVLVLGTEECMYPALLLAQAIEAGGSAASVAVHATTRSPIAISSDSGYPITNGYEMSSFYEKDRNTYVYNLQRYDTAIVLSDAAPDNPDGPRDLASACGLWGMRPFILYGGEHV